MPTSLELYLVRHGVAAERGPDYPDDTERPLTDEGASKWRRSVAGLREMGVILDLVITSPFQRTQQTAEILVAVLRPKPRLVTADALMPGRKIAEVLSVIAKHTTAGRGASRIGLVGHEPDLGELAARLLGAKGIVEFKKGAVVPHRRRPGDARRPRRSALVPAAGCAAGSRPVKRALVVINPISGASRPHAGGSAEVDAARRALAAGGYDATVVVTTGQGHAAEATRRACADGAELVVAWGGDGTMNEVARMLAFSDARLALVPAGSGNGLARDLGVPRDPLAALAIAVAGRPWRIDAGAVNGALFFNVAGSRSRRAHRARVRGVARTPARTVAVLRNRRARADPLPRPRVRYQLGRRPHRSAGAVHRPGELAAVRRPRPDRAAGRSRRRATGPGGRRRPAAVARRDPPARFPPRHPAARRRPGDAPVRASPRGHPLGWELHLDGEPSAGSGALDVQVHAGALTVMAPDSTRPRP